MGVSNDAINKNTHDEDDNISFSASTLLTVNIIIMDDFENYAVEIDSELIGQDLDDIDPFAEFTDVENEEYDDGGILYE